MRKSKKKMEGKEDRAKIDASASRAKIDASEGRAQTDVSAGRAQNDASAIRAQIVILGAGASGLAAAMAAAAGAHPDVLVIDGNDKVGKKLYATGNGRCNFTNAHCSSEDYNQPEDGFVDTVFNAFSPEDTLNFFKSCGMMARLEDGGRYYPYSGQAASLVDILRREAERRGCRFLLSDKAVQTTLIGQDDTEPAEKNRSHAAWRFLIELESGRKVLCDRLVIACGGRAGLKTGSTGDGYGFAKAFGHTLAAPRPALTAVESDDAFLADLKGVRSKGGVSLYKDGAKIAEESGEIQFTGSGVSGICVFNLTRHMEAARPTGHNRKTEQQAALYEIRCDFVPELRRSQVEEMLSAQLAGAEAQDMQMALEEALIGIVNDKLAKVIARLSVQSCGPKTLEPDGGSNQLVGVSQLTELKKEPGKTAQSRNRKTPDSAPKKPDISPEKRAAHLLKELKVSVSHTKGWNDAQVTCGGVRREEIEPRSMESKLVEGLYFCGEVVDVDGRCGGFNLQWAWSSGVAAGRSAAPGRK